MRSSPAIKLNIVTAKIDHDWRQRNTLKRHNFALSLCYMYVFSHGMFALWSLKAH